MPINTRPRVAVQRPPGFGLGRSQIKRVDLVTCDDADLGELAEKGDLGGGGFNSKHSRSTW